MISIEQSFDFFYDTLNRLNKQKLEFNDRDLEYEIFEELVIEAL